MRLPPYYPVLACHFSPSARMQNTFIVYNYSTLPLHTKMLVFNYPLHHRQIKLCFSLAEICNYVPNHLIISPYYSCKPIGGGVSWRMRDCDATKFRLQESSHVKTNL